MTNGIAKKIHKRNLTRYSEIMFLLEIAEYMRKTNPDYDYQELFSRLREILK